MRSREEMSELIDEFMREENRFRFVDDFNEPKSCWECVNFEQIRQADYPLALKADFGLCAYEDMYIEDPHGHRCERWDWSRRGVTNEKKQAQFEAILERQRKLGGVE